MGHATTKRQWAMLVLGPLLLVAASLLPAGVLPVGAATDPVEELRLALMLRSEDMINPTPGLLQYREESLKAKIASLKTLGDLRRAITLASWRSDPAADEKLRALDARIRAAIADRFFKTVAAVLVGGDANSRLALANMIAEMGPTVQPLNPLDTYGFARLLTPTLLTLAQDKDLGVRQEALRALGNINAKPHDVVAVFVRTLKSDVLGPRRIAADGLGQLVRVVSHLQRRGRTETGVEANRGDVFDAVEETVQAVGIGLLDADSQVRGLCLETLNVGASALSDLVPDAYPKNYFPPRDRKLTEAEKKEINNANRLLRDEMRQFDKVLAAFTTHGPALAEGLKDPEGRVRLGSIVALESIAHWRLRILKRINSVPPPQVVVKEKDAKGKDKKEPEFTDDLKVQDPLEKFFQPGLPVLGKLLSEGDVRVRRGVVDFLEVLEESATPAIPALVRALQDSDRFVRWGAARALSYIAPEKSAQAIPQLAKLLSDPDLNVRLTVATTLSAMGVLAKDAVPELSQAIMFGDGESRVAVMQVLQGLGPQFAASALPNLVTVLGHTESRVRKAAAETLGSFGPTAKAAVGALRRLLGDEDPEVRSAASDALLSILPPPVKD